METYSRVYSVELDVNDVTIIAGDNHFQAYVFITTTTSRALITELLIKGADSLRRKGTTYIVGSGSTNMPNPQFKPPLTPVRPMRKRF
jgi:hypothetical protein